MAMEFDLIPLDTKVEENGQGEKVDVSASFHAHVLLHHAHHRSD